MDIHQRGGEPLQAARETRDWLANVSRRVLPSSARVIELYEAFSADLPALAASLAFEPATIPYVDFERIIVEWLLGAAAHA